MTNFHHWRQIHGGVGILKSVSSLRLIDPVRWESLNHNPVLLLKEYTAEKLEERAREAVLQYTDPLGVSQVS